MYRVQVNEGVRFTFIRPALHQICHAVWLAHEYLHLPTPVLTGAGPDAQATYADEPTHLLGYAFDFRLFTDKEDESTHAKALGKLVWSYLQSVDQAFRVVVFSNGTAFQAPNTVLSLAPHPDHLHVAYTYISE